MDSILVVVCGDESVGKSSLISSLVKESYSTSPGVLPPITISKDDYSDSLRGNNEKIKKRKLRQRDTVLNDTMLSQYIPQKTVIVDTSPSDMKNVQIELKRADVIWLVYSDHYTYERISLHWMPMFRSLGVNLPIILCANKSDLIPVGTSIKSQNIDEFIPLVNEFKEIEACIRCSAKLNYNVVELFYLCQRSITFPISPIFDLKERNLKPPAIAALKRCFFLCDKDQDGYLNFSEFALLQAKCFPKQDPFTSEDFAEIMLYINEKKLMLLDSAKGITEDGFILLNKKYAEEGRHETIWGILRSFNYTDSLSLNDKFLYPNLDVNPLSSVELSPHGYRFFVDLFLKFDKDNDGGLNELELTQLFLPTPGIPKLWQATQFPASVVRNEQGYVTLQGWLAQWNLTTFLDHKTTLEYLAYLGFEEGSVKAVKTTKARKKRQKGGRFYRQPVSDRNIFSCLLLGAPKLGKTLLLELFLQGLYSETYSPTIQERLGAKDIELRGGKQCYLILEELGELEPAVLENRQRLEDCDAICYTYDSLDPELFQYLIDLRNKYSSSGLDEIPSIFVGLKADLDKQQQRLDVQPENYTKSLHLSLPLHISSKWTTSLYELFIQVVDAAQNPSAFTPGLEKKEAAAAANQENLNRLLMTGTAITTMALASLWIWRSAMTQR